ncbi:hypothetical protein [Desulfofundulus thermosubterraneus]|uniref:Uncharacterized protein n=1 Tax=Desulfofundulus thermosubterraneus DSM 16057 TaxID=1121432 RepID=A0A1M6FRM9_9FIRM|nr:hypothetical protein [Desulfofundulus thermosubterraneus]SHJ00347.1 hypothetical protein SAMN02745219_01525 [Desulfofundulus thermosubterraneus DSM 16057]
MAKIVPTGKILLQTIPVILGGKAAREQREVDPEKRAAIHALVNGQQEAAPGNRRRQSAW